MLMDETGVEQTLKANWRHAAFAVRRDHVLK